mmetsp:Transcript_27069/g.43343  ORF Transcript_27069/g.43343 Transcript_27069/m.43343 type:complete len:250 (+) Transcript_27069:68-817(+)
MIPLGGGLDVPDQEVPSRIKDSFYKWWWLVFFLLIAATIGSFVALKVFDGLIFLMVGIWAYSMVKDDCKLMTQQCLFSFGFLCVLQGVMNFIILAMSLPGRRTTTTETHSPQAQNGGHAAPNPFSGGGGSSSSSYTVTVKTTPFFSEEQGWYYNFQSWMMVASVLVFVIAALLTRITYSEYPTSIFADPGDGLGYSAQQPSYGGYGGYGSANANGAHGGRIHSGGGSNNGRWAPSNNTVFGGTGQRLGS